MKNIYFPDFSCMHGCMCVYGCSSPLVINALVHLHKGEFEAFNRCNMLKVKG